VVATRRTFFDTSTLLGGLIELGPATSAAQAVMTAVAERRIPRPHTAWHCCLEFYAVATRLPEEVRLAPADAWRLLQAEVLGRFVVHQLAEEAWSGFLQAAVEARVAGGRIYDAHIADIARLAGARVVVTDNVRHFSDLRRHGIRVISVADFAADIHA
jgi:predicted nucleic acid-binding protein